MEYLVVNYDKLYTLGLEYYTLLCFILLFLLINYQQITQYSQISVQAKLTLASAIP